MALSPDYHQYIQSPQWKARCEQYWQANGRWCRGCKSTQRLVIHHLSYDNFKMEPMRDLVGLCHTCHLEVHRLHRMAGRRVTIRDITLRYIRQRALDRMRQKTT